MIRPARRAGAALGVALLVVLLTGVPARADTWRDRQWYLAPMRLAQAQQLGRGGAGVTVAVIDSGVDFRHPDLRGATLPGRNMAGDIPLDNLDTGHGTGMAVLIGGRGHGSGDGLLGTAPRSRVLPIRPIIDTQFLADGIRWAVRNGAKVINMSFHLDSNQAVRDAIDEAVAADVVVVAATGNDGGKVGEPAAFPGVLAVGAVGRDNRVTSFSNRGPEVDLVAYGVDIPVAYPRGGYRMSGGTSAASAIVAGSVALIRARYPDMSAAEVVDRLLSTATDRGPKGRDDRYGAGQLNLVAALTAPRTPPSGSAAPSAAPDAAPVAGADAAPAANGAPVGAPAARASTADRGGPSPLVIVAIGIFLLLAAVITFMVLRVRRSS